MADTNASDRWQRIDSLLEEALELDLGEREAFLQQVCEGDKLLRGELESLLKAVEASPAFFEEGALALATPYLGDFGGPTKAPPLETLERLGPYRIVGEIGAGGMSRVYLAERDDGEFARQVAIKVMDAGGADRTEYERRFRAERQILASFDHPSIARVFDGGVTENRRPYLVMEYVSGQPLTSYCSEHELGLEERLELFIQVCGAVQYAHQRLVVHRDLKPSNILVQEGGRVKLLDFGIAKILDTEASGFEAKMPATRTGLLLLTPEYAAPEQLQGREITTATDGYALGVLLYELIAGNRPFQLTGMTPSQVHSAICDEEPKKPSTAMIEGGMAARASWHWPPSRLAGDLDTVVLKALRKQPQKRYGSVWELAEELRRFLAGEPVSARPVGVGERLLRKARRHKRASAIIVVAIVLLALLGALALHARSSARRQAMAAQRFGQEVERIEAILQRAFMAPLHDIRPELNEVRIRMAGIETQMAELRGASRAIGEYALGRGHLGLGEEAMARIHLERAWQSGYTEPRVAYALGLTLSRLYRDALDDLAQVRSKEIREVRRAEIETEFRDPAVRALEAAGQDAFQADFVAASLDFFAGRSEQALQRLESRSRPDPWFHEADLLAGDIHAELQRSAAGSGRKAEAGQSRERAEAAFQRAIEVARSDPRGYEGLCNLWSDVLAQRTYTSQEDLGSVRSAAIASCNRAVEANRDSPHPYFRLGQVERLWATYRMDQGDDPRPFLEPAKRHLEQAATLAPEDARPWVVRGALFRTLATYLSSRGENPVESYDMALASYERATQIDPADHNAHVSRSLAELHLGDFKRGRGEPAEHHFENAVAAARRAAELLPGLASAQVNLGIAYEQLAIIRRDRSAPARDLFETGAAAFGRALAINPEYVVAQFNLAQLLLERGEMELMHKQDPTASVATARPLLKIVLEAWPDFAPTYLMRAQGESLLARWALALGDNPSEELAAAKDWADRGAAIRGSDPEIFVDAARVYLISARWRLDQEQPLEVVISSAIDFLDSALNMHPRLATAHQLIAEAYWLRARELRRRSADPRQALEAGLGAARRALEESPTDADSHLQVARLEEQWASWLGDSGGDPANKLAAARGAVEKTLALRSGYSPAEEILRRLDDP